MRHPGDGANRPECLKASPGSRKATCTTQSRMSLVRNRPHFRPVSTANPGLQASRQAGPVKEYKT